MEENFKSLIISFLLFFMFAFSGIEAYAQEGMNFQQANALFGNQKILKYRKFSLDLQDESKAEIDKLIALVSAAPDIIKHNIFVLQVFTCEKELNVKPYIGVVRAQQIINYLEEELGLPRKKCLIQDNGVSPFDKDCVIGSGLNIYLKPGFYE